MCKVILQEVSIFLGGSLENTNHAPGHQGVAYNQPSIKRDQTRSNTIKPAPGYINKLLYTLLFTLLLDTIKIKVYNNYIISDAAGSALNICGYKVEDMRKLNQEQMIERIKSGKHHISLIDGSYYISSGKGQKMTFKSITEERANEWLALGADLIEF